MIHNTVYLHEYNMTFNDLYCLMTSTMKAMDHHVVSRHVQQNVLRNLSGQSLSEIKKWQLYGRLNVHDIQ